jgi:hypothetical protein
MKKKFLIIMGIFFVIRFIAIIGTGMVYSEDINDNLGDYKVMSVEGEYNKFMNGGRGRRSNFNMNKETSLNIESGTI